jgi:hypothetical protein
MRGVFKAGHHCILWLFLADFKHPCRLILWLFSLISIKHPMLGVGRIFDLTAILIRADDGRDGPLVKPKQWKQGWLQMFYVGFLLSCIFWSKTLKE